MKMMRLLLILFLIPIFFIPIQNFSAQNADHLTDSTQYLPIVHKVTITTISRVSVASNGTEANDYSNVSGISGYALSANGQFVAFTSYASNLVSDDSNGKPDVFLHDIFNKTTERVSITSDGLQANGGSYNPAISSDGRFVVFESIASNLVLGDGNDTRDIFLRDLQTRKTERVSISSSGNEANDESFFPTISADGRYVAFISFADLVKGTSSIYQQVYVRDLSSGKTEIISVAGNGSPGDGDCWHVSLSTDGRFVAFSSEADNLTSGDPDSGTDIYLRDRQTGQLELISITKNGDKGNNSSSGPSISADGRYVTFFSQASNFFGGDTNALADIYIRDRQAGTTQLVSVSQTGGVGNAFSQTPTISADGRFVAFISEASNLVPNDTNNSWDIFVRDMQAGTTQRISMGHNGDQANYGSSDPSVSADGRSILFYSQADNLVVGDQNGNQDAFVARR